MLQIVYYDCIYYGLFQHKQLQYISKTVCPPICCRNTRNESSIPGALHWAPSITNNFRSGKFLLGSSMKHALGNVLTVSHCITSEWGQYCTSWYIALFFFFLENGGTYGINNSWNHLCPWNATRQAWKTFQAEFVPECKVHYLLTQHRLFGKLLCSWGCLTSLSINSKDSTECMQIGHSNYCRQ